ncbi:MAG: hypothetical protein KGV57_04895, partial [Fusobacterium sp.]|nr:hypothetical protein [Fusobacterium sp.]
MKKVFLFLLGIVLVLAIILYFAKNFIVREILVRKLSDANNAPVSIGKVDLSLRKNYIILKDIEINSNINKDEVFIKMDELKSFYKMESLNKKITFRDTEVEGFLLFNEKNKIKKEEVKEENKGQKDTSSNKVSLKDKDGIKLFEQRVTDLERKQKKDKVVSELKNIYLGKIGLDKAEIDLRLKEKYDKFKEIESDLKKLNSLAVDELKTSIEKIKESEKKDMLSTIFSELKNIENSTKKILEEADADKLKEKVKNFVLDDEFKETLDIVVKEFLDKNHFVISDLDSYINIYLNTIYEKKIYDIFLRYNKLTQELDERKKRDKEIKDGEIWELYFENISINSNMYGINFYGEVHEISSRISKNIKNIPFKLFGEKGETIGKIEGFINLNSDFLLANTEVPEANLIDFNDKIFNSGKAAFFQSLLINPEKLSIKGNLEIKDIKLNPEKIVSDISTGEVLVDELLASILTELKTGNIDYSYNTSTRRLEIKSDISNIFEKVINDDNLFFKTNVKEKIKKEYLDTI